MEIDLELTEKSAKNTQRWWKLTATIDLYRYIRRQINQDRMIFGDFSVNS